MQRRCVGNNDIVAGFSSQHLHDHDIAVVIGIVNNPNARFLGEVFQHLGVDVITPTVDIDRFLLRKHGRWKKRCEG